MSSNDMNHLDLWINGRWQASRDGRRLEMRSPADGRVIGSAAEGTLEDLEEAVAGADKAFREWSKTTAYERERVIRKATQHVRGRADELGKWMTLEQGKPFAQSHSEIIGSCDTLDYYASEAVRIEGYINPTEDKDYRSWVIHQPVGVCGLITPWNYPVSLLSWKLGPALAAGCSVVVKPTPVTPWSPTLFCQALAEGGLPTGLVQVVTGPGPLLGEAMIRHPRVAKIAMTGSTRTGKRLMEVAGPLLKKITLELGGHGAAIVCADADLDLAAKTIAYKGFRNMGQSCSSVNRVYAHASIHDALVQKLKVIAEKMTVGDGWSDPKVDLGPMATGEVLSKVEDHVADALGKGATLVYGGRRPAGKQFEAGNYYLPTILTGARPGMKVMTEETFGPVVPFQSFERLEDAVTWANDSAYGLVAYLFTRDLTTTIRVSEALEAGTVCVNHGAVNTNYGPYCGWKDSGFGMELSRRAIFEYLKTKHIKVALSGS